VDIACKLVNTTHKVQVEGTKLFLMQM